MGTAIVAIRGSNMNSGVAGKSETAAPERTDPSILVRADRALRSSARVFAWAMLPLFALYLATGNHFWEPMDPFTNRLTAWSIATSGTPVLEDHEILRPTRAWIVDSPRGPVSQYPPGAALLAVPGYWLMPDAPVERMYLNDGTPPTGVEVPMPSAWPALVVAAVTTSSALGVAGVILVGLGHRPSVAVLGVWLAGTGTSAWTVAGDSLWQHGPNMLWLALAMLAAMKERWLLAGMSFGLIALTRPPLLLVGFVVGAWLLWRRRVRDAGRLVIGVAPGLLALVIYNYWLFGRITISGGYRGDLVGGSIDRGVGNWLLHLLEMLASPRFGLLKWSPLIAVAGVGAVLVWRRQPEWLKVFTAAGLAYLVFHMAISSAGGGFGFWFYRYPLETLLVCVPILVVGVTRLLDEGAIARVLVLGTATFSIVSHASVSMIWQSLNR